MDKRTASSIGIILGIVIIVIGLIVQGISIETDSVTIGDYIKFGADFYTEMYSVTKDVGYAVNATRRAVAAAGESICDAIGWLMVALGLFDIGYFLTKVAECNEPSPTVHIPTTYTAPAAHAAPAAPAAKPIFTSPEPARQTTQSGGKWVCTCGRHNADYISSCVCGMTKNELKRRAAGAVSAPIQDGQKYCPQCGTAQRMDRKVCFNCGQPFDN